MADSLGVGGPPTVRATSAELGAVATIWRSLQRRLRRRFYLLAAAVIVAISHADCRVQSHHREQSALQKETQKKT